MSTKKSTNTTINDRFDARRMVLNQLSKAREDYEQAIKLANEAKSRADAVHSKISTFQDHFTRANIPEEQWNNQAREEIASLRRSCQEYLSEHRINSENASELNMQIASLEKQLQTFSLGISTQDLITHHERIKQLCDRKTRIVATIKDMELKISDAEATIPVVISEDSRPDLLARLALGEANAHELDELDVIIANEVAMESEASSTAISKVQDAEATIIGLRRMLSELQDQLEKLDAQTPDIEFDFLRSEANKAGDGYVEAAEKLLEMWALLCLYDDMAKAINRDGKVRPTFKNSFFGELTAPAFRVPACDDPKRFREGRVIAPHSLENAMKRARAIHIDRLRLAGMTLV